ncbi:MAG TPA: Ku protein, partial [Thermoanaerobaculia bacterium]
EITPAPAPEPRAQVIDLMAALKASLAAAKPSAAEPVSIADRKPAKRSARAAGEPVAVNDEAPKKKSSKR